MVHMGTADIIYWGVTGGLVALSSATALAYVYGRKTDFRNNVKSISEQYPNETLDSKIIQMANDKILKFSPPPFDWVYGGIRYGDTFERFVLMMEPVSNGLLPK